MTQKRDRLQLIKDILQALHNHKELKPTHIQYKANLSSQMLKEYLEELLNLELIEEKPQKRGRTYLLTQKGYDYINNYKQITEFMNMFGL